MLPSASYTSKESKEALSWTGNIHQSTLDKNKKSITLLQACLGHGFIHETFAGTWRKASSSSFTFIPVLQGEGLCGLWCTSGSVLPIHSSGGIGYNQWTGLPLIHVSIHSATVDSGSLKVSLHFVPCDLFPSKCALKGADLWAGTEWLSQKD